MASGYLAVKSISNCAMSNVGGNGSEDMPYFTLGWVNEDDRKLLEQPLPQAQYVLSNHLQLQPNQQQLVLVQNNSTWIYEAAGQWNIPTIDSLNYLPYNHQANYERPVSQFEHVPQYEETTLHDAQYVTNHQRQYSVMSQVLSPNLSHKLYQHLLQQLQANPPLFHSSHSLVQYPQIQYQTNLPQAGQMHLRQLLHPEYALQQQHYQRYQQPSLQLYEPPLFSPRPLLYQFPGPDSHEDIGYTDPEIIDPDRGKIYLYPNDDDGPSAGQMHLTNLSKPKQVSDSLLQSYDAELTLVADFEKNSSANKANHRKRRRNPEVDIGWSPLPLASLFSETRVQFTLEQKAEYVKKMKYGVLGVINMRSKGAWSRGPNKKQ